MKIAFYYITTNKVERPVVYNEGLAVLSALAKEHGAETSLQRIDLADMEKEAFSIEQDVDVHAVSFASQQFAVARRLISAIGVRKNKGLVVVGGVHATVFRQSVIDIPEIDLVVSGEGEGAMKWLLEHPGESLDTFDLPNCHVKGRPVEPLVKVDYVDLNTLPIPDRTIFNKKLLQEKPEFIFSRGCPFSCAYCANEFFNDNFGFQLRRKSPEYAIAELENAFTSLEIASDTLLIFHDDVFILDTHWLESFARLYKERFKNPFRCNTIAKAVNEERVKILKSMNCVEVWIGLESGDEQFRKTVLKKNVTNDELISAFKLVHDYDMKGVSFNLFGCPGETLENLHRTYELNKMCQVYNASTSIFYPFPGTSLHDQEKAKGNLRELTEEENDRGVSVFALNDYKVSKDDYFYYSKLMQCYVNGLYFEHAVLRFCRMIGVNPLKLKDGLQKLPGFGWLLAQYKKSFYCKN